MKPSPWILRSVLLGVAILAVGGYRHFRHSGEAGAGDRKGSSVKTELPEAGQASATAETAKAKASGTRPPSSMVTAENAATLMEEARVKYPNVEERAEYCGGLIEQLCAKGETEEAWRLVQESSGQIRTYILGSFFRTAKLTDEELRGKILDSGDKFDMEISWCGFLDRFKGAALEQALISPEMKALRQTLAEKGTRKTLLDSSITTNFEMALTLSDSSEHAELLKAAAGLCQHGQLKADDFMNLLERSKAGDGFRKWELLSELDLAKQGTEPAQRLRGEMVAAMVVEDSSRAIDQVMKTPGKQGMVDMQFAIRKWTLNDPKEAADWFAANEAGLDAEKRSGAALGFYATAMEFGEFGSATEWARRVENPGLRDRLLKDVEAKSRK